MYISNDKRLEEGPIYERMISEGQKIGLDVFVFTPADVHYSKNLIHALVYDPKTSKWSRKWRAFPDMIFDRCRIQQGRRFEQLKRFRAHYGHLLYLNKPLRNKWITHQILSENPRFRRHLPETVLYESIRDVRHMLKSKPLVFLKPINGTGGRGILRIQRIDAGCFSIQGRNNERKIITPRIIHASSLRAALDGWNMRKRYIIQEGIPLQLPSGRVHDYRMLVQKNGQGEWVLTGCAGRIGAKNSVTSNLHGGGNAVPMVSMLRQWIGEEEQRHNIRDEAEQLGLDVAAYLEESIGPLCELALDLAIDKQGNIYILEVNPKPAREVFNRIGEKEIYRQAIVKPLEYALWLYKQHTESSDQDTNATRSELDITTLSPEQEDAP